MIVYEDFHFGKEKYMVFYHFNHFSIFAHLHRSYELLCLHEGKLIANLDGRNFELNSGDMILILPYEIHSYTDMGSSICDITLFSPDYIGEFYRQTSHKSLKSPVFRISEKELSQIKSAVFYDNSRIFASKSCLYFLADRLLEQTSLIEKTSHTVHSDLLHQILLYIQEHYLENLTLQNLAEELGYNRTYLSRYINQSLHMSLPEFLQEHRICYACYLLKNKDLLISEIAFTCGFNNLRTFNRCFHNVTGMTPREYRNNVSS